MKRGGIYWVNLGPTQPPEFGKTRPGLVVSKHSRSTSGSKGIASPVNGTSAPVFS
jgi:mRNA-degrading endonuclease toxin of MazEF toxin-antitoxin module